MSDLISKVDAVCEVLVNDGIDNIVDRINALPSIEVEKKKAKLKENGDWDCPDVGCDECDHHRSVSWCSLAIPNHEEIDDTYKMVNEAFFEGFDAAEKQYRFLIEYVEELDKKLADVEWIPVSERLPSENEEVFVYLWGDVPHLASVNNEGQWETDNFYLNANDAPKAWIPLPKPYREDGGIEK